MSTTGDVRHTGAAAERPGWVEQGAHGMLPGQNADERARHAFLMALKDELFGELAATDRALYESRVRPALQRETGASEPDRRQIDAAMRREPFHLAWLALARAQQELYVDSTAECVERQLPELVARYRRITAGPVRGSLRLDPAVTMPVYQSEADIHCVPGGYGLELCEDDVYVGARYDIGVYTFAMGRHGAYNESKGTSAIAWLREARPALRPRRILDLGCTAGFSTVPYAQTWPEAEVHGIDLSAPALRYGHARAESLGAAVHFSQQDAVRTDFPDGHFDLVVSHILCHETSMAAIRRILRECRRLLAPGGVMLHVEVPLHHSGLAPYRQFEADWHTLHNNEPFWGTLHDADVHALLEEAGFPRERHIDTRLPDRVGQVFLTGGGWWAFGAEG